MIVIDDDNNNRCVKLLINKNKLLVNLFRKITIKQKKFFFLQVMSK